MSSLPATMKHVGLGQPGPAENLRIVEGAVPRPAAGEVLLKVQAAGINRPDIAQRQGSYPPPPGASPILGLEAAGTVVGLGDGVSGIAVGDRLAALCNGGAYAAYVAVPAAQCLPWPKGYDALRAAALPETFFTVWANVFGTRGFTGGRLAAGETLLVHGGTSGIGVTAIQLARAFGAKVFATAGSAAKCAACEALGARAINYREADFAAEIARLTEKRGVDVVLDMVGAPYFARNLKVLAKDGRLVYIAFLEGSAAEKADLVQIMVKRLTVTGSTMRPRTPAEKAEIAAALREKVWPKLEAGAFAPLIHQVFPAAEVAAAHRLMESSAHIGKIVLDFTDF